MEREIYNKKLETLKDIIIQAIFIDKVNLLTEVSLMGSNKKYSIGGIYRQDIKVAIGMINDSGLYRPIYCVINSYGVMCLQF